LAWLIQNGFTGEARKTSFSRLLVHFNPGLQNGFTLQYLDLRKIDEAEASISHAKDALNLPGSKVFVGPLLLGRTMSRFANSTGEALSMLLEVLVAHKQCSY